MYFVVAHMAFTKLLFDWDTRRVR